MLFPDAVNLIIPEDKFKKWSGEWNFGFAEDAVLEFTYDMPDNKEKKRVVLEAQRSVWKSQRWSWPGNRDMILVDSDINQVVHYSEDFLLEYNDYGDSIETQRDQLDRELEDMCSDIMDQIPLTVRKLTDGCIESTLGPARRIRSIILHRQQENDSPTQATITIAKPKEDTPNDRYRYDRRFREKSICEVFESEDTWTGTFNII